MEYGIGATGIGGQGVQLGIRVLAQAAVASGRRVQLFASYGGMMRGGNSDSYLVIGDAPIVSPPVPGQLDAVVVMHDAYADTLWKGLAPEGLAIVNSSVVTEERRPEVSGRVVAIPALDIAADLGAPVAAMFVAIGALAHIRRLAGIDALVESATAALPSYRAEAAAVNAAALRAGWKLATSEFSAVEQ